MSNPHANIQSHVDAIAEYFRVTQAKEIKLQSGDVIISAKHGNILNELEHKHTFAAYSSYGMKKCVDCGYKEPI